MIIFLYGSDAYRLKENIDTVVRAYQKKHISGINLYRFDFGHDRNFDGLSNAVKSLSFFDETKLILIKNIFSNKIYIRDTISLVENFKLDTDKKIVLLFAENKNSKDFEKISKDLLEILKRKNNIIKELEPLSGIKLVGWVKEKFKENGHNVSSAVASLLIDTIGNESWALKNEIDKLSNYRAGGAITEQDVNFLIGRKINNNVFDMIDAVGNRNKAKAFETMYRLINSGHDSHYLLSMLIYQFENLLSVSDGSTPKYLHPFVARKAINQAGKFEKYDLKAKFGYLANLDIFSKNGQTNLEDALYNFVLS